MPPLFAQEFPLFKLPFDEFVTAVTREAGSGLLRNGLFPPQISLWRHVFGSERVHIWNREKYNADAQTTMNEAFQFLGIANFTVAGPVRAFEGHHEAHPVTDMSAASRAALVEYYARAF